MQRCMLHTTTDLRRCPGYDHGKISKAMTGYRCAGRTQLSDRRDWLVRSNLLACEAFVLRRLCLYH